MPVSRQTTKQLKDKAEIGRLTKELEQLRRESTGIEEFQNLKLQRKFRFAPSRHPRAARKITIKPKFNLKDGQGV